MPTLDWIGKKAVVRHHTEVPFHLLKEDPALSCGGEEGAGNLIVQGDNLKALKALLPHYAGQVKCIYIDPPYNTGNEGWVYNDNVNSPEIRQWLESVVGKEGEDQTRHDKWLCMMYPRLVLLKQFLREDGSIWISIDDTEVASLKLMMDEIFGSQCFVGDVIWRAADSSNNDAKTFSLDHNHTMVYSRSIGWRTKLLPRGEENNAHYKNSDNDPRGPWFAGNVSSPNPRPNLKYEVTSPIGISIPPPANGWRWKQERMQSMIDEGEVAFSADGTRLMKKTYLSEQKGLAPSSLWHDVEETGHNRNAKYELIKIFPEMATSELFKTPKPTKFLNRILALATDTDDLILDSFAGSGTTGHAVLKQNAEDGGNRRFILVEMDENIAQNITAERVKRVSQGYTNAKGEAVAELGSGFRFAKLGKTLFDEAGAIREDVRFQELAEFVYFHETGSPLPKDAKAKKKSPLLGVVDGKAIYLLFNGILADLSPDGGNVLTQPILTLLPPHNGPKVIYAAACRLGPAKLERERIQFKQTPYALRVD